MWREADHPAHGIASEVDLLANAILRTTNVTDSERRELIWLAQSGAPHATIAMFIENCDRQQVNADAVLVDLLELAWPVADREKYDWTYSMLTRSPRTMKQIDGLIS